MRAWAGTVARYRERRDAARHPGRSDIIAISAARRLTAGSSAPNRLGMYDHGRRGWPFAVRSMPRMKALTPARSSWCISRIRAVHQRVGLFDDRDDSSARHRRLPLRLLPLQLYSRRLRTRVASFPNSAARRGRDRLNGNNVISIFSCRANGIANHAPALGLPGASVAREHDERRTPHDALAIPSRIGMLFCKLGPAGFTSRPRIFTRGPVWSSGRPVSRGAPAAPSETSGAARTALIKCGFRLHQ